MRDVKDVLRDIDLAERHLEELRSELSALVSNAKSESETKSNTHSGDADGALPKDDVSRATSTPRWPLSAAEYERYGRQLILPEIGLRGQQILKKSSVLVVGLGGLGCPAAKYLAGAGVGRIGLLDGDVVEVSNLHRQILHTTSRVGVAKVESAARSLAETNNTIQIVPYVQHLTPENSLSLFEQYDLILDCTDHPTSRYLISDVAVFTGKPLVSASALKTDGQLIVLNNPPRSSSSSGVTKGPCYRCVFPKPPPAESLVSCGEGGILGPVVGVMGVLQALEAIKVLTQNDNKTSPEQQQQQQQPSMLIFSAYSNPPFRSLRMRPRRADCAACGDTPSVTAESLTSGRMDYVSFCGVAKPIDVLTEDDRVEPDVLRDRMQCALPIGLTLVDVREKPQFELGSLPGSINVPFSHFESGQIKGRGDSSGGGNDDDDDTTPQIPDDASTLIFVCRLGNDSQLAVKKMVDLGYSDRGRWIGDLKGGLRAWKRDIQPDFPDF